MVPTQGDRPNQGVAPPQGGQTNQGTAPPQGGRSNQGVPPPQGGQPNQGAAPLQSGRPNQGVAPPQGGPPNQGVAPLQGGPPNQGMAPPQGGQPNQGLAPLQGGQPDQGMASFVGGQPEEMSEEHTKIQKKMFQLAMDNQWKEVEIKYKDNPFTQEAKITSSEDTILHIAVLTDKLITVKNLVEAVTDKKILEMVNNRGNTALHLAAAMGKVSMCKCMVEKHQLLIGEHNPNGKQLLIAKQNKNGETPLFLAALHGKKDAFLYLHSKCPQTHGSEYWRRKEDGNSILHAAIVGEYFDLAYQIIKKYKALDLVNSVNERGQSVLHLLASNPSAFQSGSHLGRIERLIYRCIVVNQLEETMYSDSTIDEEYQREDILPKNYATCMQFYLLLRRLFRFSLGGLIFLR